jgi:hypothetical protein
VFAVREYNPNITFYVITTVVHIDKERVEQNPGVLKDIKLDLIRMNVEFFFIRLTRGFPGRYRWPKSSTWKG